MRKQIKPKAQIMFLLLTIFVIMISVSSVSAAPLPSSSQVYVSVNGSDTNNGSAEAPYLTIQKGMDSISENGTLYIANGVYNGTGNTNITISKNMSISGQSQTGTIINGTNNNWIFQIQSGVNLILKNLTITNGRRDDGAGIYNSGTLAAENCTFSHNIASNHGGAICNWEGAFDLNNCTFVGNQGRLGGGILNLWNSNSCSVTNCTFTDNTATEGAGINNNNDCTITIKDCNFTGNHADYGGVIINWSNLTITGSNMEGNSATYGGAICIWLSGINTNIHFNRIVGNTALNGNAIYCSFSAVNATNNWWSSNNPVWADLLLLSNGGTVDNSTWLYMTMNATPTTINNTQTILVTVNFNNIYNGTTVTSFDHGTGHIPDGTSVNFGSALGIFNPTIATTVNGIATALFTANQTGTGNLNATADNQTVTQLLTVNPASYLYLNVTSSKNNPNAGETFVITYKLSNSGPENATNVMMSFQVPAGLEFVNATVDNGTWSYNPINRTVTWTLTNVAVGDPYLYLTVKALGSGSYTITPTITSDTYNRNTDPLTPFTVNVQAQNNSNSSTVNAASTTKTVAMKDTGLPLNYLVLAILAVISGFVMPRRK